MQATDVNRFLEDGKQMEELAELRNRKSSASEGAVNEKWTDLVTRAGKVRNWRCWLLWKAGERAPITSPYEDQFCLELLPFPMDSLTTYLSLTLIFCTETGPDRLQ